MELALSLRKALLFLIPHLSSDNIPLEMQQNIISPQQKEKNKTKRTENLPERNTALLATKICVLLTKIDK
jgi:hypothetical protein